MNANATDKDPTTDAANWHCWMFYYNARDERVIVPKRWGYGWTANFAWPMAYVLVGLPMALGLLIDGLVIALAR